MIETFALFFSPPLNQTLNSEDNGDKAALVSSQQLLKILKQDHGAVNSFNLVPVLKVSTQIAPVLLVGNSTKTAHKAQDTPTDHLCKRHICYKQTKNH